MIDFEEELKKFHPSLEVEDVEDAIYNQDVTTLPTCWLSWSRRQRKSMGMMVWQRAELVQSRGA